MAKYQVIYADPAWIYNKRNGFGLNSKSRFGGGAEAHYPLMTVQQICELPVEGIADEDSLLFIWVTWPHLESGLAVIKSWGFRYITCAYNWIKLSNRNLKFILGTGYYQKANSEICLIGKRGNGLKPAVNDVNQILDTWDEETPGVDLLAFRGRHSEKPIAARQGIERLYPDARKIELFSRDRASGWHLWGNEVESDIELAI